MLSQSRPVTASSKTTENRQRKNQIDLDTDADNVLGTALSLSLCDLWWTGDVPEEKVLESPATSKKASGTA